jgi:hypothetical protein
MALSIEQQRKYARMLTPEQLANYVKNPDMGNEIGITPSVFAEAIAEINAEDQEPQPAASNTVIDREVNEMLGGRSQGLVGSTSQQFSHGGMIPGYQNGGDVNPDKPLSTRELYEQRQREIGQAQGYSDTPEVTPSWMAEASGGMSQPTIEDANKLLGILTGMPIDLGGQWGFFEEGTTGRELSQDALQQALLYGLGIKGAKMAWGLGKGALGKSADLLTRPVRGILARDKPSWLQRFLEQTTRMTSGPQGGNLFPIGTRFPVPDYRTPISTVGQSLRALPVTTGIGGAGILGGHELLNKWTGGDFDLFSGEPGDITLGPVGANPPPGQGDRKKDDIAAGKKVSAEQEMRDALGLGDPVDVPVGGSGIDQMISSIQKRIDAGANEKEKAFLAALEGRTAITDRISELEESREGDYEEYLQNRFYNALANIAQPGGIGASLSASDSGYSTAQDDLENILADLKMQGEGQDIETARVAADLSRIGEEHLPSLYDAQLAQWQEAMATARSRADQEFEAKKLFIQVAAAQPTALESRIALMEVYSDIMENASMMGISPAALDSTRRALESLIMGGAEVTADQEDQ